MIALLGATLDQILEFPACLLLGGVITRRGRGVPVDFFDVGSLASGLWTINDAELQRQYYGVGPGFAIVAGGLMLLRASYWIARRRPGGPGRS